MIDATMVLVATIKTLRIASPMKRRMIASRIISRKRGTMPFIMTSPLCQAQAPCLEKGVTLVQDLLHALVLGLAPTQAVGATTTIMCLMMIASRAQPPSVGTHTPLRAMMAGTSIALKKAIPFLPPLCSNSKER
jgi:hypothetical protein